MIPSKIKTMRLIPLRSWGKPKTDRVKRHSVMHQVSCILGISVPAAFSSSIPAHEDSMHIQFPLYGDVFNHSVFHTKLAINDLALLFTDLPLHPSETFKA